VASSGDRPFQRGLERFRIARAALSFSTRPDRPCPAQAWSGLRVMPACQHASDPLCGPRRTMVLRVA